MAGPVAATKSTLDAELTRKNSIDSAISAISSQAPSTQNGGQDASYASSDVAALVTKAGSAEAVIQSLLKDKHSQAQQNSQLWRLVDKQRAMILGLNKDLERALKEKERYRAKLKEALSGPKPAGADMGRQDSQILSGPSLPQLDVKGATEVFNNQTESPMSDSPIQTISPINTVLAPYPTSPPLGGFTTDMITAEPAEAMPIPQEHAYGQYDHDADERAADQNRKQKAEQQQPHGLHYTSALPPSRGLPPDPPRGPPPNPPNRSAPNMSVVGATPQVDEGISSFPTPPRKAPPAPLQLQQHTAHENAIDDDTDSDLDDILEVGELGQKRGRRRTRAEDDRDREIRAWKEAEARSASKKSSTSKPTSPVEPSPPIVSGAPHIITQEVGTASLAAVLSGGERSRELMMPPIMSPGLPASPRPGATTKGTNLQSPPLSPRTMGNYPAAPLSPRPPRAPIPLPPNTPLATPAAGHGDTVTKEPTHVAAHSREPGPSTNSTRSRDSPVERTQIYKGLTTEEYPDLLLPPNALPSITMQVASSRMKPSRASLMSLTQLEEDPVFTLAIISRSDGGELWRAEKDSASLLKLDSRLKQCAAFTATTPDRSLFVGHAPAKVDARRAALDHYLDEVLNTPFDLATALDLCKYLSTNTLPPNTDEMGGSVSGSVEGSSHMIGPDGRPIRSGYLTKRGKNFGGWKSRFFLLDGPLLKYYETPGGAHLGTIKLQGAQIGKQQNQGSESQSPSQSGNPEDSESQYRHAFLILEPKKKDSSTHVKHVLCAENDRERDLWVDALLQWIDFGRDDNDGHNQKSNGTSKSSSGRQGNKSKKGSGSQAKSNHHAADSDALVGVRYDAVQPGDAPSNSLAGRHKPSAGPGESSQLAGDTMSSQVKVISGPKDPQPISDTAAWGNKSGLTAPTYEEKKARKRSFFGFGPKMRSNSDGQDSIPGVGDLHSSTPPSGHYHAQTPVRPVFGAQLAEAVRFCPPSDVNVPLPSVVYRCIQYLDAKDAVLEEGIFRLSGSNLVIRQLHERFNVEGDINLITDEQFYDIHAIASLLKLYLRELPTSILTSKLAPQFEQTNAIPDRAQKLGALRELAQMLPLPNATLLKYLLAFLIKIINNSDVNKMTARNVGIVFSPTLNVPAPVFATMMQYYDAVFGIPPEQYELPFSGSEQSSQDISSRFEPPAPARPSTSSGTPSPHRQTRIDSTRDYQRSTPTPPLSNLNPARESPTPPLSQGHGHDQRYHSQRQDPGAHAPRGAYDAMYGAPPKSATHGGFPPRNQSAAYDRVQYHQQPYPESSSKLAVQDQTHGAGNRGRRESAMYMGLQNQSSRGYPRETQRQ
ncbi:GTPase-activating protein BEM3 [Emericellopsis cladophorae]|uniref:GTPase-activating protein BEM3 n=1 Tax=Emericellopsis cladophorae TaxID=2686198 RepID=A0A9P9XXD0_9HYPO|nr:GTPase-activating protein BEM3 [Emericellopsis cladophorae]KAI6779578.1 GTPase-activating protein BEM3 [Emericellopsis cladophorae]